MLSAHFPFSGSDPDELCTHILAGKVSFSDKFWKDVSKDAIDLVIKMLDANPKTRISASKALEHKWFNILKSTECSEECDDKVDKSVLEMLMDYKCESLFKKSTLYLLVKMVKGEGFCKLKKEFKKMDLNKDGMISFDELKSAYVQSGIKVSDKEINLLITKLDFVGNQKVNYTEFLVATIDRTTIKKPDLIKDLFKQFDRNRNDTIEQEDIVRELQTLGRKVTKSELSGIMKHYDKSGKG